MEAAPGALFPFVGVCGQETGARGHPFGLPSDLQADWDMAIRTEANLLLEGSPGDIEKSLAALRRHLHEPVREFRPADGASVPQSCEGTLILLEVARLDATQQAALLRWFDAFDEGVPVRIVSTSSEPLFALVGSGAFASELYYRLNAVLIKPARAGMSLS